MPITIKFIATTPDGMGAASTFSFKTGQSLMQAAVSANLPGIEADCGGLMTCATCHVYVREPHASAMPQAGPDERAMLDFVAAPRMPNSRLSCQIDLVEAMDGMTVDLPASQH